MSRALATQLALAALVPLVASGDSGVAFSDMFLGAGGAVPVMQRETATTVWGTAPAGSPVNLTLSVKGQPAPLATAVATTNSSGVWLARLPAQNAGWNRTLTACTPDACSETKVSLGETLLCVGQSNMGMQVGPSVRGFDADNSTAENAASVRYSGRISLHARLSRWVPAKGANADSTRWYAVDPITIKNFSAVCWYAGRDLYDSMGGGVPVGLIMNAVGGHPIEAWLGPKELAACGIDSDCGNAPSSKVWNDTLKPLQPYTVGTMIWDQGEADVSCHRVDQYVCMQTKLVESYRAQFQSDFPFIAVQLPGYDDPNWPDIFRLRLAQDQAAQGTAAANVCATYDLSCAENKTSGCPHGNVHNVHKQPIGKRLAAIVARVKLGDKELVTGGPRVNLSASSWLPETSGSPSTVTLVFSGGTGPFVFKPTRNCSACCGPGPSSGDFDASIDGGKTWVNASESVVAPGGMHVRVRVQVAPSDQVTDLRVRYTANQVYPQCALYNAEALPALPFDITVPRRE